ncbi:family 2 glycosyl transferase [Spongiactinospora gelatinilytica]|uniref:Family 2 glycosyl transferase n=1 Tax=Spongiactinospora gelatinilytica TaxID=2666298 RepID=A0A2W2GSY1_9ACTN|nr:glycosyltransferase family 2 protein [Spongiactinospora gelatinilytica]PZG45679.1 family 2 glycosyl transferase [Spongiactinospora gelatinilytica]
MSVAPESSADPATPRAPEERAGPRGYVRTPSEGDGVLRWAGEHWVAGDRPLGRVATASDAEALRPLRGLRVEWPGESPVPLAPVLDLAAAGVPLFAAETPAWAREADSGLAALLAEWDGSRLAEGPSGIRSVADLRREEHSVRLRRHGLRARRTPADRPPTVSVVMSSMRPPHLAGALGQIARQRHVRAEVVLGLHGVPGGRDHPDVRRAADGFALPLTVVEAGADRPFGELLHLAAGRATGEYIAKWDDDDWYGPEHLADLLLAKEYSGADVVGVPPEFFYLEPLRATVRRIDYSSEVWSDYIAGGTILMDRAKYQESGGFSALPSAVDADLLKRIHAAGGRIYRTHGLGYMLRRSLAGDHTWRLSLAHFLRVAANQWRGFRPSMIMEAGPGTGQGALVSEVSRT